jgi:hypothetical protein
VLHLNGRGVLHEHALTEFAIVEWGSLNYPRQSDFGNRPRERN